MSEDIHWTEKLLSTTTTQVTERSGIYVIGHKERIRGLTLTNVYVYVGKSKNLRRRSNEHDHYTEKNPELAEYLRKNRGYVYFWYTTDVPNNDLDAMERSLIRSLKPEFNNIEYKEHEEY